MATSLAQLAERAQDLYYQDFATRDTFFDVTDFIFHAATYYSATLNQIYQATRRESKMQDGFTNVEIPAAWMLSEIVKVVKVDEEEYFSGTTEFPIFSFDFDAFANGLHSVRMKKATGKNKKIELVKISNNDINFISLSPETCIGYYWVAPGNKIVVTTAGEVEVWYVPAVVNNDVNCVLSDNIAADVIKNVLTIMFGAKNGNTVQMTNDSNNNPDAKTQQNPLLKNAQ
jgi:hypothetical protein